jgi:hypothetical protein
MTHLIITFEPRPGIDSIRSLRRLLKFAGRHLGLKALHVEERSVEAAAKDAPRSTTTHSRGEKDGIRTERYDRVGLGQ